MTFLIFATLGIAIL